MSDLRKFCCGFFVGASGLAAAANHHLITLLPRYDDASTMILSGLVVGSLALITFGERK